MHLSVLGETVTLTNFPRVAVAIDAFVPFGCVDRYAYQRHSQCRPHLYHGTGHHTPVDLYHPPFLADFINCRIGKVRRRNLLRRSRPARFACAFRHDFDAIGLQGCVRISRIFIGRDEVHHTTAGALLEIVHQGLDVLFDAFAWNHTHDQLVLGV